MQIKAALRIEDILPDPNQWTDKLYDIAYDHITTQIDMGGAIAAGEIGIHPSFTVSNEDAKEWAKSYVEKLSKRIMDTTTTRLKNSYKRVLEVYKADTVAEAIENGASLGEFASAVREVLDGDASQYRSEMIAQTEFTRAQGMGRLEQMKAAGAKTKVWAANPDCCDFCSSMDGMTVDIEDNFFDEGDQLTIEGEDGSEKAIVFDYEAVGVEGLHPWCRCSTRYEFD